MKIKQILVAAVLGVFFINVVRAQQAGDDVHFFAGVNTSVSSTQLAWFGDGSVGLNPVSNYPYTFSLTPGGADGFTPANSSFLYSVSDPTFAAYAQNTPPTNPDDFQGSNVRGPSNGTYVNVELYSVTGPTGGTFAYYDVDSDGNPLTTPALTLTSGSTGGTGTLGLTDQDNFDLDGNSWGHYDGRVFAVDVPGTYTVQWILTASDNPSGYSDSTTLTTTFITSPEPSTVSLIVAVACSGLIIFLRRRRKTDSLLVLRQEK